MRKLTFLIIILSLILGGHSDVQAQAIDIDVDASSLIPEVSLYLSPRSGSFVEGSTFSVPILIDTRGQNINSVEVRLKFDPRKLSIIGPSGDTSIVGVWVEPPSYDNTSGTAEYVGVIPGGITTSSGLISSITFKAKEIGKTSLSLTGDSKVLLNDGYGTRTNVSVGRADYDILPKATAGVVVFSETHPFQNDWYNNNSPIASWEQEPGVTGFSYELDNKPGTIPDNNSETSDTTVQFPDLEDGIWYFHIKSNKNGVWGQTSSFVIKIDTIPPAEFKPTTDYILAAVISSERALVSFFTTDNLSGVDHYEVGVIDKSQPTTVSPIFVESESPFQVPFADGNSLRVLVRAFDRAGNVREANIDIQTPLIFTNFFKKYTNYILIAVLLIFVLSFVFHYLYGHHIVQSVKKAWRVFLKEKKNGENHTKNGPRVP